MQMRTFGVLAAAVAAWGVATSFADELRPFEPKAAENVAEATKWAFEKDAPVGAAPAAVVINPRWSVPGYRRGTAAFVLAEDLAQMLDAAGCRYSRDYKQEWNVIEMVVDSASAAPCLMANTKVRIRPWDDPRDLITLTVQVGDKFGFLALPGKAVVSKNPSILSKYYGVDAVKWAKIVERFAHDVKSLEVPARKDVSAVLLGKYFDAAIKENPVEAAYYASLASAVPTTD